MFSSAKKVAGLPASTKAKAAKAKPVDSIPGLEEVAALDACAKAIKGLLDLKKDALKVIAIKQLLARGLERKSRPDGLSLAAGEYATGKVSISKRSVSSPLTPDELDVLAEAIGAADRDDEGAITAIPGFAETVEKSPAMLAVNPAYADDEVLLKRIDKALSGVKGIPEDFIIQIPADTRVVVSETATDAVFRLAPEAAELVFPMVASATMGAVFKDLERAWDIVRPLLVPDAKAEIGKMLAASLADTAA